MRTAGFAVLLFCFCAISARAQLQTVKDYHELKEELRQAGSDPKYANDPRFAQLAASFNLYFKGVGDGLFWANAELLATQGAGQRKEGQLYCTPAIGLDSQNYQSLLDAYLPKLASKMHFPTKTWKSIEDMPVGFVLVLALIDAFPCDKGH